MAINHRKKKSKSSSSSSKEQQHSSSDELFQYQVEKIIDDKLDKDGVTILYKTRWKGYSAGDDTWEPAENVASTGHVDRYLRLKRQKKLNTKTPGVAIIEYEDGETEMVNLHVETFRNYQEDDDEDDNDSDTNNNRQINNFDLIIKDGMIELLWPLADIFFPCKVISYTKLKSSQGGSKKRSRKTVDDNVKGHDDSKMESIPKQKKYKDDEKFGARQQQLKSADEEEQMNSDLFSESGNDRESVRNISDDSIDNYDSDRLVDRLNHDNPLFDDEPKYDSSDNDDDEEESDSDSNEGHADSNKQNHPVSYSDNNQTRKLTFEEQWKLKLQRTQEMMNREGRDKSQMSGLMARQL